MNRRQKIIMTTMWVLTLTAALVLLAVWSGPRLLPSIARAATGQGDATDDAASAAPLFDVPAFTLTDQENRTITHESLRGHPWVAAFIFTRCPGPCPLISKRMQGIQDKLPNDVKLVSFSLDPKHDTPAILKTYAAQYDADPDRWHFLTGDRDAIDAVRQALKIGATRGAGETDIIHGTHLILVNPDGKVHDYYAHGDDEATQRLVEDATKLAE